MGRQVQTYHVAHQEWLALDLTVPAPPKRGRPVRKIPPPQPLPVSDVRFSVYLAPKGFYALSVRGTVIPSVGYLR